MNKKAGFARLQKMNSFDDVVEMAAGDERLLSLDRFGPKAIPQTEMEIRNSGASGRRSRRHRRCKEAD